jgi:hypothetical protein
MRGARRRLRIVGLALVALVAIGAIGFGAWTRVIQPALLPPEPSMPALSSYLQKLQDYYHFRFLPDGYPGKLLNGTLTVEPIYGRYVIADYIRQYKATPTPELRDAIAKVAHAAVARMEPLGDALVFWYPPEMHISRQPDKHYSGLTQAYYAEVLYQASQVLGDDSLRVASEKCFRSLLIPKEQGGVYYGWGDNVALAEVPTAPRDLILNGWLSILASVHNYADLTGSPEAADLFKRSAATVARLLPLYDDPDLKNSRYNLTGPVSLRLEFAGDPKAVVVRDLRVDIPQEGTFPVPVDSATRWEYWVNPNAASAVDGGFKPTKAKVGVNVVLSRLSYPDTNMIRFSVDSPAATTVTLSVSVGKYNPLTSEQSDESWQPVQTVNVGVGTTDVAVALPWSQVDLIAYPTNFIKKIQGKNTNVYHVIHIMRLRSLAEWTGDPVFTQWADTWQGYVCAWASMPLYDGLYARDYRIDAVDLAADPATFCK